MTICDFCYKEAQHHQCAVCTEDVYKLIDTTSEMSRKTGEQLKRTELNLGAALTALATLRLDAEKAIATLQEIAGDGCGFWAPPDQTCVVEHGPEARAQWCWSCVAKAALDELSKRAAGP